MRSILASFLVVTFFVAPLSAQELTGTLQQIQKSGKIKIGYRASVPPLSFLNKDGAPVGYSIDLCEEIATAVKQKIGSDLSVEYIPVTSADRFDALTENRIDILCGATTKTLTRSEKVDFTQLTFVTGGSFMSLKKTKIINNFEGKRIGVSKGTTTAENLKKLLEEAQTKAEIVLMDSSAEALEALNKEEIDAIAADQVVLIGLALTSGKPGNYSVLPDLFSYEPFALAVRRNDADFRLVADRVIAELYRTGKIKDIYDRWFGVFAKQRSTAFDALIQLSAIPE
ncbi:MAG: amino acid ABC transporter substrate-binding protein [Deltaproteobacteria bacterium]|jgi:ABC-type amino acid transport substrate-binding protein|nr:amino acid ABC transporter substrate-binding protein [Deltaproteobacteria bacterium]